MSQIIYRTYAKRVPKKFREYEDSSCNKPRGGLWGCRGTEWLEWCETEDFPCVETYYEWVLKKGARVFEIRTCLDLAYLMLEYGNEMTIDYGKVMEDYDAVELFPEVNSLCHAGLPREVFELPRMAKIPTVLKLLAINTWDVPSIVVLRPNEFVEVI